MIFVYNNDFFIQYFVFNLEYLVNTFGFASEIISNSNIGETNRAKIGITSWQTEFDYL